ncbi:hypothetical protein VNO77_20873 [Canavalia gladiata]|uniref:PGG domain-containing protein n=1 Tax=Canavalia gladiata TaxID=3824 RepID=A0AAN9LUF0_CANGL
MYWLGRVTLEVAHQALWSSVESKFRSIAITILHKVIMSAGSNSNIVSNGIVVELLNKENYSNWSKLVQNYLMGEDLWHGVVEVNDGKKLKKEKSKKKRNEEEEEEEEKEKEEEEEEEEEEKKKKKEGDDSTKNRKALHAIQLSCGNEALSEIRNMTSARQAWYQLKASCSEDVKASHSEDHAAQHDPAQTGEYDEHYGLTSLMNRGLGYDAMSMIYSSPDVIFNTSPIDRRTVLHAAVSKGLKGSVALLVQLGRQRLLKMQDKYGYTALALAAELTDDKNGGEELPSIKTKDKDGIPVILAAAKGHRKMTQYLFSVTPASTLRQILDLLFKLCIAAEIFTVAVAILQHRDAGQLNIDGSTDSNENLPPIYALARMRSAFRSGTRLKWWQKFFYMILIIQTEDIPLKEDKIEIVFTFEPENGPTTVKDYLAGINEVYEQKMKHQLVLKILQYLRTRVSNIILRVELHKVAVEDAMLLAAKNGIFEFINIMSEANPELLFVTDLNNRGILSFAILNRHEKVFNLLKSVGGPREIIASSVDVFKNNMLHLAAELGPSPYLLRMPNAALQMQRELQWFKAVKNIVPSSFPHALNAEDQLPDEIFRKRHEQLLKDAQQWAKDTSSSFTLVGTLIITIMFAAAFTVPGGTNGDNGIPVFLGKSLFNFFIIADTISLVTSASSVLMFIGILTSRYDAEDFYACLPLKLLFGLVTLFFSVASMMAAFCAALALLLKGFHGIVIASMILAPLPISVFVPSLLFLCAEILSSTIRSDI